jgi:ribosomal protein S18 acetylase RimI-like enzyme
LDIVRLDRAALIAWPARERQTAFGWVMQATDGQSGRVNSTWPIAWTGKIALAAAIDRVEAWYADRGRRAWFRLAEDFGAPAELAQALAARGYTPDTRTLVMTRELAAAPGDADVAIDADPGDAFFQPLREAAPSDADFAERRDVVRRAPNPRAFALLCADGRPAAVGASVAVDDLAMIFVMRTSPWAQRRGLARRVLRSLMAWARDNGACTAFLQVEAANGPAVALYEGEGFVTAYSYVYWRPRG